MTLVEPSIYDLCVGIYDDDPEVITLSRSDFGESSINCSMVIFSVGH